MSKNVKFLVGKELNLSSLTKNPGQLIVALDEDNSKGKIYFDESNTNRIELSPGLYIGDDVVESTTPINADTLQGYTAEDLINMGGGGNGGSITIDTELSTTSENPVQNKIITTALDGKSDNEHTHSIADVKNLQTTLDEINETANTQSDWNQTDETAPDYVKNRIAYKYENPKSMLFEGTVTLQELTLKTNGQKRAGFFLPADFQFPEDPSVPINFYVDDKEYLNIIGYSGLGFFMPSVVDSDWALGDSAKVTESETVGKNSNYIMFSTKYSVGQSFHIKIMDSREWIINTIDADLLPENLGSPAKGKNSWILGDRTYGLSKMGMQSSLMIGSSNYEGLSNNYESGSGSNNLISGAGNTCAPEANTVQQSIVFGNTNKISGSLMFALGSALKGCNTSQVILGKFNALDPNYGTHYKDGKYVLIVGNGKDTDATRSNAHTLDWQGNAEFQGDVKANACGGTEPISLVELASTVSSQQTAIDSTLTSAKSYTDTKVADLMSYSVDEDTMYTAPVNADTLNGYTAEQIKSGLQTQIDNLNSQMGDVSSALDAILGV